MQAFKRLATAAAGATFLLIAIGGLVRATKSGLGCGTDWPHCSGRLLPAIENRAMVIEYSHRFVAGLVLVLLAVLAVQAYRKGLPSRIKRASVVAFSLVVFQALLGAVVVILELQAVSVLLHLATALSLLAVLLYIALTVDPRRGEVDAALARRTTSAAATVLVLVLVGSYVSGSGAGYVFPDWPLMDGRLIPELSVQSKALHFLHRALALGAGVIVVWTAIAVARQRERAPLASKLAHSGAGLFTIEVLVGGANVITGGNDAFVTLHLALGAAIWGALVAATFVLRPLPEEDVALIGGRAPARGEAA